MVGEKRKRLAWFHRFQPESHPAEFRRHRVEIYAVEAGADHVAESGAIGLRARLCVAGANGGQSLRHPVRRPNQKVPAADGGIDHLQSQNHLLRFRSLLARQPFIQQRLKGRVKADLHK